jgi:hypothetical protein
MRNYAADPATTRTATSFSLPDPSPTVPRVIEPVELADWVESRLERITRRWIQELARREALGNAQMVEVMEEFVGLLVSFLPGLVGALRDQVDSVWAQAAELFGALAARRGLAAGEVVEEFQLLREALIRLLYQDPPLGGRVPLSLREVLRLNRAIDRGVTHASVGHTDALFFSLFEGSGIPESPPADELVEEVQDQLEAIRGELRSRLGRLPGEGFLGGAAEE